MASCLPDDITTFPAWPARSGHGLARPAGLRMPYCRPMTPGDLLTRLRSQELICRLSAATFCLGRPRGQAHTVPPSWPRQGPRWHHGSHGQIAWAASGQRGPWTAWGSSSEGLCSQRSSAQQIKACPAACLQTFPPPVTLVVCNFQLNRLGHRQEGPFHQSPAKRSIHRRRPGGLHYFHP